MHARTFAGSCLVTTGHHPLGHALYGTGRLIMNNFDNEYSVIHALFLVHGQQIEYSGCDKTVCGLQLVF